MNISNCVKRFSRLGTVSLLILVWSIPVFCGEIHDAAKAGDLAKVKALLKENPELVSGRDYMGYTPLHQEFGAEVIELLRRHGGRE